MNRISLVGRLRTQKLLGRTVLILLAFSLLTVGGSYLFVRGEMVSRYREQGMEGTMSMLQRTSTSLDRTIQALELQIQTFWKDDDVSSLLVAPEKPDFSRTSGAAAQIQGLREGNELIERCWLYLYQSGQILTDRQLLLEAGDPERPGQLERWSAAAESGTPSLWCEDGKIYLLVAFPQPKKLGLLIVQLSARDLFEQFQEGWSGLSGDPVYVYDGAGEPVFPNRMTYPEREELMVTGESPREGVYALSGQRDTVVCVARSQTAGWYCLTYWNSGDWLPSPQEILTAFLPAAAVLLLLILILSLVILQVIYRPIQRIVESMLTGQETEAGQDEAGLISAALARGQRENQRLTGLLSDVRPALAQRFFQSLLEGGQTEPEEVSRMLAALESPFPLEGTYLVLAVEAVPERSASAVEVTYGDILDLHPYGNALCLVEATGQQILDALEMGARKYPQTSGGFLQVSGLTYTIDAAVPSSVVVDENGAFQSVDGPRRVTGVKVGGQPLELDRVYTLASHNYMLKSGGDGYTMFQGCTLLKDETVLDNQALIRYLGQILEGDLSAYSAPGGQGRIQIAETAEETGGAPAEPEEPAAGARIYVVQPGDCLWTIARQELGGGLRWVEIYDANRDQIQDPDRIQAGMELELPA